jgi:class 3 adenylate cyclase/tetratricopeptide (TPR) repeat protein
VFADLAGSTRLGELLDPEDFRDLTSGALARMGAAIEELGGTVRGSAGDGVLGFFGAPVAHEDDAERAVLAGLKLVEAMRQYGLEAAERWGVPQLEVRVGIETGLAVLGEVRAGRQVQYDASGDCLNTAARLEGAADPGGVLVGPLTYRLIGDAFEWGDPRSLELKGKTGSVPARHAVRLRADRPRRGAAEEGSRLVGRDGELAVVGSVVSQVAGGAAMTLFVTGEAGIGKTRLTKELRSSFDAVGPEKAKATWLEGACVSYATDEPYLPFRQILRQLLGPRADSVAGIAGALKPLLGDQATRRAAPLVGLILGQALEAEDSDRLDSLSAESVLQGLTEVFAGLVTGLAEAGPVAIVIDDMHWADAASVGLTEGLMLALPGEAPVLIVVAMRPETDRPAWDLRDRALGGQADRVREVALARLDGQAERALVSELIGEGTLPEQLESRLLARAEGNPFFLGELLRSLRDVGAVTQVEGHWTFDDDVPIELPETAERVVLARIDRLAPAERDLLTSAAVIGREFDVELLARVGDADVSPESLQSLTRLGLLEADASGGGYRFTHPLIQETAYNGLLRRGRVELHRRAAAAIEGLKDAGSDEHHAVLARHHSAAGNVGAAVKYHRLAGLAAQRVVALNEALAQFDAALDAAGTLGQDVAQVKLPELHLLRARVRARTGNYPRAADDVRRALAGARQNENGQVEVEALNDLGWLVRAHSYEEAIRHHEQAARKAQDLGDTGSHVTALGRMSMIYSNRLQLDRGLELAERAVEIARRTGLEQFIGTALDCLKLAALQLGDLGLLDRTVAEIVEVQERTGDLYLLQWAYIEGATSPLARGRFDEAQELIDRAMEVNRRFEVDQMARNMIREAGSWIERGRGEPGAAVLVMRDVVAEIRGLDIPEWSAWVEATLASHLIELGEADEAVALLESALEHSDRIESPNRAFRAASHLAWGRWLAGDANGSQAALARAEGLLAGITAPPGAVFLNGYHSYLAIARTRSEMGDTAAAAEVLLPVLESARTNGWALAERQASAALAASV